MTDLSPSTEPTKGKPWRVTTPGLYGPIVRYFVTEERAVQWTRQIGRSSTRTKIINIESEASNV